MLDDERFEAVHRLGVTADVQLGVDEVLERPQPQSVQSSGFAARPIGVCELLDAPRPATSPAARDNSVRGMSRSLVVPPHCHRLLKHRRVQFAGIDDAASSRQGL